MEQKQHVLKIDYSWIILHHEALRRIIIKYQVFCPSNTITNVKQYKQITQRIEKSNVFIMLLNELFAYHWAGQWAATEAWQVHIAKSTASYHLWIQKFKKWDEMLKPYYYFNGIGPKWIECLQCHPKFIFCRCRRKRSSKAFDCAIVDLFLSMKIYL